MPAVGRHSYTNAKVRAMRSHLVMDTLYQSLVAAPTLSAMLALLSSTHLSKLGQKNPAILPDEIQKQLAEEEMRQLQTLKKHSKGDSHDLMLCFLERSDAELLKVLLRRWHHKETVSGSPISITALHAIPVSTIIEAGSLAEIADLLDGTPFRSILARQVAAFEREKNLFPIEFAIDQYVFGRLWDTVQAFPRKDRQIAARLVGIEIDLKNIQWIDRYVTFYHLPAAEVRDLVLAHGFHIGPEQVQYLASGGDVRDVLGKLTHDAPTLKPLTGDDRLGRNLIERVLTQILLSEANRAFSAFPFSVGSVIGYIYLLRFETQNIRMLIDAKEYGLSPEAAEELLIV